MRVSGSPKGSRNMEFGGISLNSLKFMIFPPIAASQPAQPAGQPSSQPASEPSWLLPGCLAARMPGQLAWMGGWTSMAEDEDRCG